MLFNITGVSARFLKIRGHLMLQVNIIKLLASQNVKIISLSSKRPTNFLNSVNKRAHVCKITQEWDPIDV